MTVITTSTSTPCNAPDNRLVLNELYAATNGPYWTGGANSTWNTSADVSTWLGVTCNGAGNISQLSLPWQLEHDDIHDGSGHPQQSAQRNASQQLERDDVNDAVVPL